MRRKLAGVLTAGLIVAGMTGSVFAGEPPADTMDYGISFTTARSVVISSADKEGEIITYNIEGEDMEKGMFSIVMEAEPFNYEDFVNDLDDLTQEEKDRLIAAYKECEPYEENIASLIEQLTEADDEHNELILEQIDELNAEIDKIMGQVTDITDKIDLPYMTASFITVFCDDFEYEEFINAMEDLTQDEKDKLIQLHQELGEYMTAIQDLTEKLEGASDDEKAAIDEQIQELSELISKTLTQQAEILGDDMVVSVEAAPAESLDDVPATYEPNAAYGMAVQK